MKKLFLSVLAIASLVACNKEDLIQTQAPSKIAFGDSFVENVTRTTTADLDAFNVWGFMDEKAGTVFVEEDVTKTNGVWSYVNTQYWMPGHNYYFAAIAPMDSQNWGVDVTNANTDGLGVISFKNEDGSEDLIYAATSVTTSTNINEQPDAIKFQFNHLLSKVKFTFVNGFKTNNVSLKVKNVKMSAPASAELAVNTADWWVGDKWANYSGNVNLGFADEVSVAYGASAATAECLTIPASANQKYTVTFTIEVYYGEVLAATSSKTATIEGVALQMGKAYNFTTTLDHTNATNDVLYPITFGEPQVLDWNNVEENFVTPIPVASAAELVEAVAAGNNVMLTADINLDDVASRATVATVGLTISKDIIFDGAGHKVTSSHDRAINISGAQNVTFKNMTLVASKERAFNMIQNAKNLVIENVKATAANYTVNIASSAPGAKVTIKNSELTGLNTVNVASANAVVELYDTKVTCDDQNESESYAALTMNKEASNASTTATRCDFVINGNSNTAHTGGPNSSILFVDCTGPQTVRNSSYAIMYGDYFYSFSTFAEALEKAKPGETIILTKDVEFTANEMHVAADKNVVVDLNGKTVAVKSLDPIKNLGTMTLKNGKIVADNSENTRRCVYNYGTMTIEDVEFVQTYNMKGAAINNEGKMTINNATVNATYYSVWTGGESETVINGGVFTTTNTVGVVDSHAYAIRVNNNSKLTINNAVVTGSHGAVCAYENAVATLNSGTYTLATPSFTDNGMSSWVFYANDDAEVKYSKNCVLVKPDSKTNGYNTTQGNGKVTEF